MEKLFPLDLLKGHFLGGEEEQGRGGEAVCWRSLLLACGLDMEQPCPVSFTSLLGTGSQQVDYIQVVANVGQDLELSHQSFVLAGCGPLCVRSKEESRRQDNEALSAGSGVPPLHVCQCSACCFINFPTFCRKAKSPDCFHYSHPPEPTSF